MIQSSFEDENWKTWNKDKSISENVRDYNFKQINENGKAEIQRKIVENVINDFPEGITDIETSILTSISRSSVTARRNELKNVGPVGLARYSENGYDRLNTMWGKIYL